ncbi:alkaline phosphatase, partial [Priestia megaterium]
MFKKKLKKKLLPVAVLSTVAFSSLLVGFSPVSAEESTKTNGTNNGKIKNVIVLIGDGMGVSYTSAHRYLKDDPSTKVVEPTTFDQYLVGQQTTYPEDPEQNVTD